MAGPVRIAALILAVGVAALLLVVLGLRSGGQGFAAGLGLLVLGWLLHEHSTEGRDDPAAPPDRYPPDDPFGGLPTETRWTP